MQELNILHIFNVRGRFGLLALSARNGLSGTRLNFPIRKI